MRITYDEEADALYIRFQQATVTTLHAAEGIALDFDADGHLAGVEVLDATERLGGLGSLGSVSVELSRRGWV